MLQRCTKLHGFASLVSGDPHFHTYRDVVYVPLGYEGHNAGVFDRGRRLITDAGCFHGLPTVHPGAGANGSFVSTINPDDVAEVISEPMIFGGHFSPHYGHFLTSTLSRFWWVPKHDRAGRRILILNQEPAAAHFAKAYVSAWFDALDLHVADFVAFDRPIRFASLTIPAASFEENNLAHTAFGELGNEIGNRLTAARRDDSLPPAYLSKSKLSSGINRFVNEPEFEARLAQHGFDIVYPENLEIADQIAVFKRYPIVCATNGSALHTGIFSSRNRLVVLNSGDEVCSNQILFDKANANEAEYFYAEGTTNLGHDGDFHNNFVLLDPQSIADEFAATALGQLAVAAQ